MIKDIDSSYKKITASSVVEKLCPVEAQRYIRKSGKIVKDKQWEEID